MSLRRELMNFFLTQWKKKLRAMRILHQHIISLFITSISCQQMANSPPPLVTAP